MQTQSTTAGVEGGEPDAQVGRPAVRDFYRDVATRNALRKRAEGMPSYTVPEAATLLSISQEYLYRLINAGTFPAVRMRNGGQQGKYVVPAKAVEMILDRTAMAGTCVDIGELTADWWSATSAGGAA